MLDLYLYCHMYAIGLEVRVWLIALIKGIVSVYSRLDVTIKKKLCCFMTFFGDMRPLLIVVMCRFSFKCSFIAKIVSSQGEN